MKNTIDESIKDLLSKDDGVFFGENHLNSSVREYVTKSLEFMRAQGVRTISIELQQKTIDQLSNSSSLDDFMKNYPHGNPSILASTFELVRKSKALGINVLGHEEPISDKIEAEINGAKSAEQLNQIFESRFTGLGAMMRRDDWAASYINSKKIGKVIVIGGKQHSGQWDNYRGLDRKLGYVSIDHDPSRGDLESVQKADLIKSDYTVFFPGSLGELTPASLPSIPAKAPSTAKKFAR